MNTSKWRTLTLDIMENAVYGLLATIGDDGYPYTRALFNMRNGAKYPNMIDFYQRHRGDLLVQFSTNTSSGKVGQIKKNNQVSVYYCAPEKTRGVMLAGEMFVVEDPEVKRSIWQEGWEQYYPAGPQDPDHTVLRMYPSLVRGWCETGKFELIPGGDV